MTKGDDRYLLKPKAPESTPAPVTVINAAPEDIYVMMQNVLLERPVFADFLEKISPQDFIHFASWMIGLIHNQHKGLYDALMAGIEVGKDVAVVLREQVEREGGKIPADGLMVIWPAGLLLNQFAMKDNVVECKQ